ncbi:MAG: tetratricopeptide repeat protein [Crocinitomicaceae bacterium]|nr:tetratricopeptide repeat protein [Flavobacteriales bacterium]NQZ35408.1 tetratricopeptide repeat protein [Crocinitomicaceae bacterium]
MKWILTFLIVFTLNCSFGQSKLDIDSLSLEVCNCIDSSFNEGENDADLFIVSCIETQLSRIDHFLLPFIEESKITPYEQGKNFGDSITGIIMEIMVEDCEVWASYLYDIREEGLKNMVDYSQDDRIVLLKEKLLENDSEELQIELGLCYLANGDMESTKEQLQYCLKSFPINIGVRYLAGLYFELNNQLDIALEAYETVYKYYPDSSVYIIIAMVKRKIRLQK